MGNKPTPEQLEALGYNDNMVVIASPGSGKTYIISEKIRALMPDIPSFRGVIAISYTNKASNELKQRCVKNGQNVKSSFLSTIDKFCIGEIIIPFLPHLWGKAKKRPEIERFNDLLDEDKLEFNLDMKNSVTLEVLLQDIDVVKRLYLEGRLILELLGSLALYTLQSVLACRKYLKARYSHIFIDEYQDSGLDQHQLFLDIVNLGLIGIAVGDEDQSIFGFSGKSAEHLLNLGRMQEFKLVRLSKNHRSHQSIIDYSTVLLRGVGSLIPQEELFVFEKCTTGTQVSLANWIDQVLPSLKTQFQIEFNKDIGVFVRSKLTGDIIDQSMKTKHRYFQSTPLEEHFNLWSNLFTVLLKYYFDPSLVSEQVIDAIPIALHVNIKKKVRSNLKKLRSLDYTKSEFIDLMSEIALQTLPEARSKNAIELLNQVLFDSKLLESFHPYQDDEIQIMTLHKAKGLEFDIVFHLDLHEWGIPCKSPGIQSNGHPDWDNIQCDIEQEANLHYVGITRAKKACFLCYSSQRIKSDGKVSNTSPSEFLLLDHLNEFRINTL